MSTAIEIDETNFEAEVLKSPLPVVVDFWAEWCGPCKMIAPILEEIASERSGKVKFAKVNVDRNPNLASQYHIQSIPTLLYFSNGLVRDQIVGAAGKRTVESKLEKLAGETNKMN